MKPDEVSKLIEQLPADDYKSAQSVCSQLLKGGAATIRQLVNSVGDEFGDPAGAKAKYALHGLAHYASRPQGVAPPAAQMERQLLADALAGELSAEHSDELKAFIIRQLQWCATDKQIPTLAKLLDDKRLGEPASQALAAIGTPEALNAIARHQRREVGKVVDQLQREAERLERD